MQLDPSRGPCVGSLIIEKVVREHFPIQAGGDLTIGQMVDATLQESAMAHAEVQKLEIHIEPEHWQAFATSVNQERDPFAPASYEVPARPASKMKAR